ncbi:hypothetical protein B4064_1278 [Caldibacillus thermoamylovorans]|uniref:Uncharacterized protein n=1 Tax=Caldibacillus thermoamylovorans TaxID=35841 RepID=A0ABD4AA27_9BACI|nr:hypothetical protein B4166_0062 [Caldibacillus thermoamylovorans]KIO69433.1 hypothetical protein B4064_1278 [Caldibacillus thermoamylovorans]KIO73615.1 hypothetical protein B4167_0033 [Caldibacillus thermoamylovorans]
MMIPFTLGIPLGRALFWNNISVRNCDISKKIIIRKRGNLR